MTYQTQNDVGLCWTLSNNAIVLSHSENAGYGLNEGLISTVKDHDEYMTQAAYWAMVADVQAHEDYDTNPEEDDGAA